MKLEKLIPLLKDPHTGAELVLKKKQVFTKKGDPIPVKDETLYFVDLKASNVVTGHQKKSLFRKLFRWLSPPHHSVDFLSYRNSYLEGRELDDILQRFDEQSAILNIGSLSKKLNQHPGIINLDLVDYDNVQVVADAHVLPFKDESIDCVILKNVIEHIRNPEIVMKEIYRVLKRGGIFYIKVPFLQPFHAIPDDFQRYSLSGFKELMKDYQVVESGIAVGPGSTFSWILREWLAILFSFGNTKLYNAGLIFWGWLTFWFKYTDIFFRKNKLATNLASAFWGKYKKI